MSFEKNKVPQLVPQAQALLEQMNAMAEAALPNNISPAEALSAARETYRASIPLAGQPEPVRNVYERQIPDSAGSIPVRIYAPNEDRNAPVLVYFHGGGFTSGDLDTHDTPLRALSNKVGCIIPSLIGLLQNILFPQPPKIATP